MPRRTSTRLTSSATPQAPSVSFQLPASDADPNILQLRRHWKWAAFSQFFFTFNALFAMNDVTLIDIENDLAYSTNSVLSRIMTRLLVTLTQDRKISVDNWQTSLRKQYMRRDPDANPIGPIQQIYTNVAESSRASTAPPHPFKNGEQLVQEEAKKSMAHEDGASADGDAVPDDLVDAVEVKSEETKIDESKDEVTGSSSEVLQDSEQPQQQIDWLDLPTIKKLDSLHTLMEWQFHNPNRLRTQMKDDDENAEWHIEPIGYDAKSNAYWLIGADRLWIQREPPRQALKRKRLTNPNASKSNGKKSFNKRQRVEPEPEPTPPPTTPARAVPPSGSRGTRAAKSRANQKLDAQAKDLAEFQRQMARSKSTNARPLTPRRPSGIRDDEWQEVPDEWLSPSAHDGTEGEEKTSLKTKARLKTGLESDEDSVSDLTELSEDDDTDEGDAQEEADAEEDEEPNVKDEESETNSVPVPDKPNGRIDVDEEDEELPSLPKGFIEWETICITLEEWENFPEQFEKATHYAEKSLYKVLTQTIVPAITAELREVEKKKRKEEAVVHRKRSSRIAIKESEKEQELLAAKKRAEEDEKTGRARRAEARRQKEEADRIKRENAREQRRKEREAKQAGGPEADTSANAPIDIMSQEPSSSSIPPGQMGKFPTLSVPVPVNGSGAVSSGSRTPAEDWELDCEVCGRQGINRDDGVPIMCCGRCLKWQHIGCHDQRDVTAGRPKRNWDAEDFICRRCRVSGSRASSFSSGQLPTPTDLKAVYCSQQSYSHDRYPNGGYYAGGATSGRYSYEHQSDIRSSGVSSQSYTQAPRTPGVTFAHYQPQQGGFSTSRPSYSIQEPAPITQQVRYSQSTSPVTGVSQYPGPFQTHPSSHIQVQPQHRWQPSSYSRSDASYSMNAVVPPSPYTSQQQPYYPGTSSSSPSVPFSQMHGTNHQSVPQYSGYQHAAPYQQSR
ncbi:uncharacterized protein BJ212DRAFT_1334762 [Suillus subaureus]|uniref:Zinc finger PHD-type domain-containing protein n=1 Tax=Suillus subaureus TaxID=48587 RepID=A0A9P7EIY2_9AGAM|nr:uncharacterized protein BJ212DRAFT_1334762 [Suillus subaureus]KAG1821960.1 hypothetical protein BJ212DRAFT_1334762 [Suillus subaureus]